MKYPFGRVAAAVAGVLLVVAPTAAQAASSTKVDAHDDAPARFDITRVTYRNAPKVASVQVRVPELQRRGTATAGIGVPNSDVGYFAVLRIRADGSLHKRLMYSTAAEWHQVKCTRMIARWAATDGYIKVDVPQGCLRNISRSGSYYMFARTGGASGDTAPAAAHLRRG